MEQIPPSYGTATSYRDFDVSGVSADAAGTYYVFVQTGWWEPFIDPFTGASSWVKHYASVLDCAGQCCIGKWSVAYIGRPYCNPEVIRLSDYLPQMNWYNSGFCN
jgi:hypothetical protein